MHSPYVGRLVSEHLDALFGFEILFARLGTDLVVLEDNPFERTRKKTAK